jgi:phosphatidylcholine synthase
MAEVRSPALRAAFAWGVHLFTASGAVAGLLALLAAARGDPRRAGLLMLVALTIDSLDGMLARAARVSEVLPQVDGRRLDDVVDYLNYVIVPAVFLVETELLPHWGFAALPVLASAYGFAQVQAKTDDDFFLGFPSYWNVLALYCWLLELPPAANAALLAVLSSLVAVPFKYLYPSRMGALRRTNHALAVVCALLLAAAVFDPERGRALRLVELSLAYPAFYLALSFWQGGLRRRAR